MHDVTKDDIKLLKELQGLMEENLGFKDINPEFEADTAEMRSRKRLRKLKKIKRAMDEWMEKLKQERHNDKKIQKPDYTITGIY
jgi:hypothetical protein